MSLRFLLLPVSALTVAFAAMGQPPSCIGEPLPGIKGSTATSVLADGTIIAKGEVNINIDGYGRAYHPTNAVAGALIHLCNAGEVYLPNGTSYHGSADNQTCTKRFMEDIAKIGKAGWRDPKVGAVRWYGILGKGEARIGTKIIKGVEPVTQADGSGFYVSPTTLADETIANGADQSRYVNPLRIPAAVVPNQTELRSRGVVMGSFGVAYDKMSKIAVPFVVADQGPAIGEATPALARSLAGKPITDDVTRANRFVGQVETPSITWIFFGASHGRTAYDSKDERSLITKAQKAFEEWGGSERAATCAG